MSSIKLGDLVFIKEGNSLYIQCPFEAHDNEHVIDELDLQILKQFLS